MIPVSRSIALLLLVGVFVSACNLRQPPPPGANGATIYRLQNCANCHGENREGKSLGPKLLGLQKHWDPEALASFLSNPKDFLGRDERLAQLEKSYPGSMSRYDNLSKEQRLVLAEWLLVP